MSIDWITAPLPWETEAAPPGAAAPGYETGPDSQPAPPPADRHRQTTSLRLVAAAAIIALVAGFVAVGGRIRTHGDRPSEGAAVVTPTPLPTTPLPSTPVPATPGAGPSAGPSAAPGPGLSADQIDGIAAKAHDGIVDINTEIDFGRGRGAGTGMILTADGEILTNNHVINNATTIAVTLVSTGRSYKARVIGTAPTEDIALLKIEASGLSPIAIGDSTAVTPGDPMVALGNAGGRGGEPAVVSGIVQAVNETITASDDASGTDAQTLSGLIETDAPIEPGDSGGALVDIEGRVVGMNSAASVGGHFSSPATAGFAIPIARAIPVVDQMRAGRASDVIHLGLPAFLGVELGRGVGGPATIIGVTSGTPAARLGLAAGDTILSVDGVAVATDNLSSVIRSHRAGTRAVVRWTDTDGGTHAAAVTLAEGPAD
ncbi:MAG: trypsin-like peptidase domain-containing protein [Acidobacteria bacterium]|nr:trypsin-like peptidase domain-containing protein [Acidobacteriota bacterium]